MSFFGGILRNLGEAIWAFVGESEFEEEFHRLEIGSMANQLTRDGFVRFAVHVPGLTRCGAFIAGIRTNYPPTRS